VTHDNVMKIGDFGTSVCHERWVEERDLHEGDAAYLAVEVLRDHYLSPAADIFSFGMTLHRLVTGYCVPTSSLSDKSCFLKKPRFAISGPLSQLIMSMLNLNYQARISSTQIISYLGLPVHLSPTSDDTDISFIEAPTKPIVPSPRLSCTRRISLSPKTKVSLSPKTPAFRKRSLGRSISPSKRRSLQDLS